MLSSLARVRERCFADSKLVTRSAKEDGTRFSAVALVGVVAEAVAADEPPVGWTALAAPEAPEREAGWKAACGEDDDVEGRPSISAVEAAVVLSCRKLECVRLGLGLPPLPLTAGLCVRTSPGGAGGAPAPGAAEDEAAAASSLGGDGAAFTAAAGAVGAAGSDDGAEESGAELTGGSGSLVVAVGDGAAGGPLLDPTAAAAAAAYRIGGGAADFGGEVTICVGDKVGCCFAAAKLAGGTGGGFGSEGDGRVDGSDALRDADGVADDAEAACVPLAFLVLLLPVVPSSLLSLSRLLDGVL